MDPTLNKDESTIYEATHYNRNNNLEQIYFLNLISNCILKLRFRC